jgi:hypothetical protein
MTAWYGSLSSLAKVAGVTMAAAELALLLLLLLLLPLLCVARQLGHLRALGPVLRAHTSGWLQPGASNTA